jgi:hypothetical protein
MYFKVDTEVRTSHRRNAVTYERWLTVLSRERGNIIGEADRSEIDLRRPDSIRRCCAEEDGSVGARE